MLPVFPSASPSAVSRVWLYCLLTLVPGVGLFLQQGWNETLFLALNTGLNRAGSTLFSPTVSDALWATLSLLGNGWFLGALCFPLLLTRPHWLPRILVAALVAGIVVWLLKRGIGVWSESGWGAWKNGGEFLLLPGNPRPAKVLDAELFHRIGPPLLNHAMPSGHTLTAWMLATLLFQSLPQDAAFSHAKDRRAASVAGNVVGKNRGTEQPTDNDNEPHEPCLMKLLPPSHGKTTCLALLLFGSATLVALSRIAMGAHWPADTLVGAALGIAIGHASGALAPQRPAGVWLRTRVGARTTRCMRYTPVWIFVLAALMSYGLLTQTPDAPQTRIWHVLACYWLAGVGGWWLLWGRKR